MPLHPRTARRAVHHDTDAPGHATRGRQTQGGRRRHLARMICGVVGAAIPGAQALPKTFVWDFLCRLTSSVNRSSNTAASRRPPLTPGALATTAPHARPRSKLRAMPAQARQQQHSCKQAPAVDSRCSCNGGDTSEASIKVRRRIGRGCVPSWHVCLRGGQLRFLFTHAPCQRHAPRGGQLSFRVSSVVHRLG